MFAITQTGIVTHEIFHLEEHTQHSQSDDQNTTAEHCQQCIAYAQADSATASATFTLPLKLGQFQFTAVHQANLAAALHQHYATRAPPTTS